MYIRMINKKALWERDKTKDVSDISADIITNCLRTRDDTLSLWYIKNIDDIDKAIIALSSNRDDINKLDYIIIEDSYITKYNLKLKKTKGQSPYTEFNNNHYDIVDIKYGALGNVSKMIIDIINNGYKIERVMERDVKEKLIKALDDKVLDEKAIKKNLLSKIS